MNWEGNGRMRPWLKFNYFDICMVDLRKTTINNGKNSWSPVGDFNPGPLEYKVGDYPFDYDFRYHRF
jgi:hypothetical protein